MFSLELRDTRNMGIRGMQNCERGPLGNTGLQFQLPGGGEAKGLKFIMVSLSNLDTHTHTYT